MAYAKTEQEWAERAARHLKAELKRADVTYDELAKRLEKYGFGETKASIANKLTQATLSAHFSSRAWWRLKSAASVWRTSDE